MKVGDKVICIKDHNNGGWLANDTVTKGKVYEVFGTYPFKDRIRLMEKGMSYFKTTARGSLLCSNLFITVQQHRDNQLNKIGIT